MEVSLNQLGGLRVDDILERHRELADRVTLALDPDLVQDSDIDVGTLESLRTQIETMKERTETEEVRFLRVPMCQLRSEHQTGFKYQALLIRYREADRVRDGFIVMSQQLQSRREALDPNYDPDFPVTISAPRRSTASSQPAHAGPSRIGQSREIGGVVLGNTPPTSSNLELEPASGPQRHTPSSRAHHHQATPSPPRRLRLPIPSDGQTFDVAFLPFKYTYELKLPDPALRAAQFCLQRLGLVFQVRLPREGSVQKYLDCQIQSFCEDKKVDLKPGLESRATAWLLMKRKGRKFELADDMPAPGDFTTSKLMKASMPNYLSEDGAHKLLLIAPVYQELRGTIILPDVETPQMKHRCHQRRVRAAIDEQVGECDRNCPTVSTSDTASSRRGTGRTLA
ncbi:hypothetical protein B0H11DRAFT_936671 [Mycena galericulata]|nr:hypothetical protein B0H11DRAFT_936671 [Mycena galericulata]